MISSKSNDIKKKLKDEYFQTLIGEPINGRWFWTQHSILNKYRGNVVFLLNVCASIYHYFLTKLLFTMSCRKYTREVATFRCIYLNLFSISIKTHYFVLNVSFPQFTKSNEINCIWPLGFGPILRKWLRNIIPWCYIFASKTFNSDYKTGDKNSLNRHSIEIN